MSSENRKRMLMGLLLAFGLAAGAGIALLVSGDDDGKPRATTTTSSRPASTTTTIAPGEDVSTAVWPWASSSTRYADPVEAARGFAVDFLGFVDPVVGEFQQGDARSGEVEIRRNATAAPTTVLVRMLGTDGSWWVLGSATANIQLTSPDALATIGSPAALDGTSTAFEATVNVQVRQDDSLTPLGEGIVMGGANGEFGPFQGSIPFDVPTANAGAIVLFTLSAEDGGIVEASVIRVYFS